MDDLANDLYFAYRRASEHSSLGRRAYLPVMRDLAFGSLRDRRTLSMSIINESIDVWRLPQTPAPTDPGQGGRAPLFRLSLRSCTSDRHRGAVRCDASRRPGSAPPLVVAFECRCIAE